METVCSSETLISTCSWPYNQEDQHHHENLISVLEDINVKTEKEMKGKIEVCVMYIGYIERIELAHTCV
jgi:hypothetical protein